MAVSKPSQKWLGVMQKQFLILMQQGFAFSGVGNDRGDPGLQLGGGRESSPAGADNAQLLERGRGDDRPLRET